MDVVCLDTQIMIWGFKGQATPNRQHMVERSRRFLENLHRQKKTCIVPSVVVAELLMPIPQNEHRNFVSDLSQRFIIPPFDAVTATYLARVWQSKHGQVNLPKGLIKYDSFIVATALAMQARCVYSEDPDLRRISEGYIECLAIPEISEQESMF